ncbi:MAG: vitamin K epoxide reductase family protein [Polyangiaceae bacterium]
MSEGSGQSGGGDREPGPMMAHEHYRPYRWVQAPIALLGVWLITSPATLGYRDPASAWSDVISGVVALVLAAMALIDRFGAWPSWGNAVTGLWLLLAPIVLWAPDAAAFANDTLVGSLLIVFGLLLPMSMEMKGPDVPPGWSYNPSSWPQRAPTIALGFVGFFAARYMAAYQLGHISSVWDPFFGDGTQKVLTSHVSKAWPVSDAGLGSVTYMVECLSGFMGDRRRYRTMPWMVAMFGFAVVPLGIVSIALVIMQPLVVGHWCSLCLLSAAAMLVMIPLALDEVVAMFQFLARRRREGVRVGHAFFAGGHQGESPVSAPARPITWAPRGMLWGMSLPAPLAVSVGLGTVWLMAQPAVLGTTLAESAGSDRPDRRSRDRDRDHRARGVARLTRYLLLLGVWSAAGSCLWRSYGAR